MMATYNDSVIPGEDSKFVQASDKVPARSNITRNEDAESDGERVHKLRGKVLAVMRLESKRLSCEEGEFRTSVCTIEA